MTSKYDQVVDVLALTWKIDRNDIHPESKFSEFDVDSLSWLELEGAFQDRMNLDIDQLAALNLVQFSDLVALVETKALEDSR